MPYEIRLYDMPSLFAGKIHAVICRGWRSRIKGRDLYDYIFYLYKAVTVNQRHLRARLIDSGYISETQECTLEEIKTMLKNRFDSIDFCKPERMLSHLFAILPFWIFGVRTFLSRLRKD